MNKSNLCPIQQKIYSNGCLDIFKKNNEVISKLYFNGYIIEGVGKNLKESLNKLNEQLNSEQKISNESEMMYLDFMLSNSYLISILSLKKNLTTYFNLEFNNLLGIKDQNKPSSIMKKAGNGLLSVFQEAEQKAEDYYYNYSSKNSEDLFKF